MRGRFIVFEGIDGSGKSTQARRLAESLSGLGRRVHLTFEPTSGPLGSVLRLYLTGRLSLDRRTIPYLFAADRSDHLYNPHNGIEKTLDEGIDVLCDRYVLSSLAYQSLEAPLELVEYLNREFPAPDLAIYLRRDPGESLAGKQRQSSYPDLYEHAARQRRVAEQYEAAVARLGDKWPILCLDIAGAKEEETAATVLEAVRRVLPGY